MDGVSAAGASADAAASGRSITLGSGSPICSGSLGAAETGSDAGDFAAGSASFTIFWFSDFFNCDFLVGGLVADLLDTRAPDAALRVLDGAAAVRVETAFGFAGARGSDLWTVLSFGAALDFAAGLPANLLPRTPGLATLRPDTADVAEALMRVTPQSL